MLTTITVHPDDAMNPAVLAYFRDISLPNAQIVFRTDGDTVPIPAVKKQSLKTIHFNRYLWSDHPAVEEAVHCLVDSWCRGLIPAKVDHQKLYATAKIILLNVHRAHKIGKEYWVTYSRNRNVVSTPERYRRSGFNYPHLILLTDALDRRQFIKSINGYHDRSKNKFLNKSNPARMKADDGFHWFFKEHKILPEYLIHDPKQELIEFKDEADDDDKKRLLRYGDNKNITKMRDILIEYNDFIKAADIKLNAPKSPIVDFSDTTIKRVFNNRSWEQGGRFYGGWWLNIKSKGRHDILINGNPTVELDYKALHPFMLYQREGITWPGGFDPYQLPEYDNNPDKKKLRNLAKDFLLTCLNASSDSKALGAMRKNIREDKENEDNRFPSDIPDLKILANRLKEHNAPISDHFCKGEGLHLQYLDSCIAERIINTMTEENKVILCIHDGFRCDVAYQEQLRELMAMEYMNIIGCNAHPEMTIKTRDRCITN